MHRRNELVDRVTVAVPALTVPLKHRLKPLNQAARAAQLIPLPPFFGVGDAQSWLAGEATS